VLDKKNRSLEKLKRFSDKTKEDLGVFIKEKSVELNDISINIDTQLKKGREILKRILSFEEMLAGKADDFAQMKKTVDTYAGTLQELINMSGRVDENLKRLGEESAYVERMGNKLKEASGKLARLETDLKTTEQKFIGQARSSLAETEAQLIKAHEDKVHLLSADVDKIEERTDELDTYLKRLESRKQEAVRTAESAISQAIKVFEQEVGKKRVSETTSIREELEEFFKGVEEKKAALTEEMTASIEADKEIMETFTKNFTEQKNGLSEDLEVRLASIESRAKELDVEFNSRIDDFKEQYGQVERMYYTHLETAAKRGENFEDEVFLNLKKVIDERSKLQEREVERYFQDVHAALEKRKKEIVDLFGALRSDSNIWNAELKKQLKAQEKEIETQLKKLESFTKNTVEGFTSMAEEAHVSVEGKVEKFVTALQAKMKELETAFAESRRSITERTDGLEKGLRERVTAIEKEVKGLVGSFDKELGEKIESASEQAEKLFQKINEDSNDVEVRVLESIESRLNEYEEEVRYRFGRLETANIDIDALEKSLRETMASTANKLRAEFGSVAKELDLERNTERQRAGKELDVLREEIESIEAGVNELKAKAYENVSSKLKLVEDEFFNGIRVQSAELQTKLEDWQEEVGKQITELSGKNNTEIEKLGANYMKIFQKELAGVRKTVDGDFKTLEARVSEFEKNYEERVSQKEEALSALADELGDKVEAARERAVAQIEALNDSIEKAKEKSLQMQQNFLMAFEARRKELEANLSEIEKRQKGFAAQTKIFERADGLKLGLEADISQMKKDIAKIGTYKKETDEIAQEFFVTKKLVEDVATKMRDFLTEKKRVDIIEGDFKKLLELSRNIDEKLENITDQHDLVQGLEIKLRELETLEADVETRYTRLENRKNVIETTTQSVDKNFEQLTGLEKNLKLFDKELRSLPKLIGDLKKEVEYINGNKEKTDTVVGKIEKLDDILGDVESRMEKLSVARDWLARTETRLEKVGRQAEEQLRLLESLVKEEVAHVKKDRGAPSLDKRQTVTKLARQGWSAEEIARATKLSRGEVELILELISDKVARVR
jgi:chromosome segregation ATPase